MSRLERRWAMDFRKVATLVSLALPAVAVLAGATGTHAQNASAWSKLGSVPAGQWELASETASSNTFYVLGNKGISRTTDAGSSWTTCNRDARTMRVISPLPGQNSAPVLFAATPGGLRRSDDGCRTWYDVPTQEIAPSGGHIRWLSPYPNNLTVLYAGMDGLGGLYRSVDGGKTWQPASQGLPSGAWLTALTADPNSPASVLVGVRYLAANHPASYLFRSTDGGLTWRSASAGMYIMPNNGGYVNGLAWSGGTLLASTSDDGIYSTTDGGLTWGASVTPGQPGGGSQIRARPPRIDAFGATADGVLVVDTAQGVYQSLDGGRSWQNFGPDGAAGHAVMLSLDGNTGRVLLGSDGGIWSYVMPKGIANLPALTPSQTPISSPTPPPPPLLPTFTSAPPTATPTSTPVPPTAAPTPVIGYKPSDPAAQGDSAVFTFFPETKHNLGYGFRDYWQANGGLAQFGFPITEEYTENGISVQYFERARFEYRDATVSLARLSAELTTGQFFRPIPFFPSTDTNVFFGATGHSVEGPFLTFWRDNGREPLLGLPLSESFKEDGSEYQWFERARVEWHPYLPTGQQIVLGNIGTLALQRKGWLP